MYATRFHPGVTITNNTTSEYVIVNIANNHKMFDLALPFLQHIGDNMYKCKRTVATNLSLQIIGDANQVMH
jgi:hypothetical protein